MLLETTVYHEIISHNRFPVKYKRQNSENQIAGRIKCAATRIPNLDELEVVYFLLPLMCHRDHIPSCWISQMREEGTCWSSDQCSGIFLRVDLLLQIVHCFDP